MSVQDTTNYILNVNHIYIIKCIHAIFVHRNLLRWGSTLLSAQYIILFYLNEITSALGKSRLVHRWTTEFGRQLNCSSHSFSACCLCFVLDPSLMYSAGDWQDQSWRAAVTSKADRRWWSPPPGDVVYQASRCASQSCQSRGTPLVLPHYSCPALLPSFSTHFIPKISSCRGSSC